jgi:hypothetical protein
MDKFQQYMNDQFIGKDPNQKNVGRDIFKALKENWKEKLGYIPLKPMALITVTDPNSPILKGIGFSKPNDLLLDNFGVMLSSCINTGGDVRRNVVDETGVVRTVHFQENGNIRMCFATETSPVALSLGGFFKVGQGTTAPARSDFDIETPFVTAPLSGDIGVIQPVWISNDQEAIVTAIISNIILGGTIEECGMFCRWRIGFGTTAADFMVSHDLTGSVNFSSGDHIQMTYTWSLS